MTRRVDIHKANLKAMGYDNLEHWLEYPQHVYVGRNVADRSPPGPRGESTFRNPQKQDDIQSHIGCGCWCGTDEACHADVIIRMLGEAGNWTASQLAHV